MDIPSPQYEFRHKLPLQLRFNDVDMFGHLNNTAYLEFLDLGKLRYFEAVLGDEFMNTDLKVVVVNINCNFYSPAFINEQLEVMTTVTRIGEKSLALDQRIVNQTTGDVKCTATTIMAGFDTSTMTSAPIPDDSRRAFSAYEGRSL